MFKLLIASIFLITTTLPANAKIGPGMGLTTSISTRIRNSAQVCTNETKGNLLLRVGPGSDYQQIREIPNNHQVSLINGEYSTDGFWWWNISYKNKRGWGRADFICTNS
jgi:uncharacterized protein YraI